MNTTKKNVYDIITEKVITELEKGNVIWEKAWQEIGFGNSAISYETQKPYSLINQFFLLYFCGAGEYLTFNQIQKRNGKIKKGAKAQHVFYFDYMEKERKDDKGNKIIDSATGEIKKDKIPFLKYYNVFHIKDTEGITSKRNESEIKELPENERIRKAEKIRNDYFNREKIEYKEFGNSAFYSPITDSITLPEYKQFKTSGGFYSTLFHEMTHRTGNEKRLNREQKGYSEDEKAYSREELIAEMGATFLCNYCQIEKEFKNSVAYIQGWLKHLRNDNKLVIYASSRAEKAVNFIVNGNPEKRIFE